MVRWAGYNVLYHKGKKVSRMFRAGVGKTAQSCKAKVIRENRRWNKKVGKSGGYVAKFVKVRKVKR